MLLSSFIIFLESLFLETAKTAYIEVEDTFSKDRSAKRVLHLKIDRNVKVHFNNAIEKTSITTGKNKLLISIKIENEEELPDYLYKILNGTYEKNLTEEVFRLTRQFFKKTKNNESIEINLHAYKINSLEFLSIACLEDAEIIEASFKYLKANKTTFYKNLPKILKEPTFQGSADNGTREKANALISSKKSRLSRLKNFF